MGGTAAPVTSCPKTDTKQTARCKTWEQMEKSPRAMAFYGGNKRVNGELHIQRLLQLHLLDCMYTKANVLKRG